MWSDKLYVVVVDDCGEELVRPFGGSDAVISYVKNLESGAYVKRIFSVDKHGDVEHLTIQFDGRLRLVPVPKEAK